MAAQSLDETDPGGLRGMTRQHGGVRLEEQIVDGRRRIDATVRADDAAHAQLSVCRPCPVRVHHPIKMTPIADKGITASTIIEGAGKPSSDCGGRAYT